MSESLSASDGMYLAAGAADQDCLERPAAKLRIGNGRPVPGARLREHGGGPEALPRALPQAQDPFGLRGASLIWLERRETPVA
jgi:hypothetical protein